MKKLLYTAAFTAVVICSQAQVKLPAPSPAQSVKQEFGLSSIELSYSRPGVKGRTVFGDLVPYGKVWRTGANGATTLSFGDDVIIGGSKVPAGKYGLLSIPGPQDWTLILTRQTDVTNPAAYKQSEDVVRIKAPVEKLSSPQENFNIGFDNVQPESCELVLRWDRSLVRLPIKTDIDAKVMQSIEKSMQSDKPAYFAAAMYYLEKGKNLDQAIGWFEKAAAAQPDAYWVKYQQARALAKAGKKTAALQAALASKALAEKAPNADYVKLNETLIQGLR
ncbi:DUF2911 domain-containing protein [Niabella terrae]